jgi:OmpA-OmpF porin, OOP family
LALSKRRADSVVSALVADYKVPAVRLTACGAGMTGPRAPNTDDTGRSKNRRMDLTPR